MTAGFAPEERPVFPGSPFSPVHRPARRLGYAVVGAMVGVAATFGNALVTVNVASLAGGLDAYVAQLSWLPAIYVAMNATANLTLVKARAQFGIPQVTNALLIAYGLTATLQILAPSFVAAALTRAASGMAAAGLLTVGVYYLIQALPARLRPLGLVTGVAIPQLGTPLARLVPVDLLAFDNWRGLSLIEMAVALTALVAINGVPLPPSERSRAFEPLDLLSIGLLVPAALLLCGVLGEGRLLWWTDTPWLGWALAVAIVLFAAALLIEGRRARPLLQFRFIGSRDILRFAAVAILVRLALAEQTYGSVGLLTFGGLTNDQLHTLFAIVAAAMVAGMAVAAVTLSETRLPYQVLAAALIIALGAGLDSAASNLTRAPQLYLSQALIGFGTTLFIGPALLYGMLRVLRGGPEMLVSLVVLFSVTQNVGGLAGSALLGTYQTVAVRAHAGSLSERLLAGDPQVATRLQIGAGALAGVVDDPSARAAQGDGLTARALAREANILAFNDVFRLVAALALLTAAYLAGLIGFNAVRRRRAQPVEAPA
jgi:hypothetical protein